MVLNSKSAINIRLTSSLGLIIGVWSQAIVTQQVKHKLGHDTIMQDCQGLSTSKMNISMAMKGPRTDENKEIKSKPFPIQLSVCVCSLHQVNSLLLTNVKGDLVTHFITSLSVNSVLVYEQHSDSKFSWLSLCTLKSIKDPTVLVCVCVCARACVSVHACVPCLFLWLRLKRKKRAFLQHLKHPQMSDVSVYASRSWPTITKHMTIELPAP